MLNPAAKNLCLSHESNRPKITITGRKARLVRLRDCGIEPIITVYEGIAEQDAFFFSVNCRKMTHNVTKNELLVFKYFAKILSLFDI